MRNAYIQGGTYYIPIRALRFLTNESFLTVQFHRITAWVSFSLIFSQCSAPFWAMKAGILVCTDAEECTVHSIYNLGYIELTELSLLYVSRNTRNRLTKIPAFIFLRHIRCILHSRVGEKFCTPFYTSFLLKFLLFPLFQFLGRVFFPVVSSLVSRWKD